MKEFRVSDRISFVCESKKTYNGFKHEATLLVDGEERDRATVRYMNRTWERYQFQSVMQKLVNKTKEFTSEEKQSCTEFLEQDHTDWSQFKAVAMIAKIGDLTCDSQTNRNDWKARMLKAGLRNSGLEIPPDWDTLSEDEKEKRLNKVLAVISDGEQK